MRSLIYTIGLAALAGGAFFLSASGCSLDGFVFDIPSEAASGAGGSSSSSVSQSSSSVSSSGSSVGGAGGSGGSGVPSEDCLNSVDDDMDGAVDCSDTDCTGAGFTCFAGAPAGWFGPVILFKGDASAKPSCPGDYPDFFTEGNFGLGSSKATCTACSCSNVSLSCDFMGFDGFSDATCAQAAMISAAPPKDGECTGVQIADLMSFRAKTPSVNVSGCQPSGGVASVTPPTWAGSALVCGGGQAGKCALDTWQCRTPPPAPFGGKLCIYKDGFAMCPAPYTDETELIDPAEVNDTRGCSSCTCTSASDFSCDVTFDLYADPDCGDPRPVFSLDATDTCAAPAVSVSALSVETDVDYSGTCSHNGGVATGTVTAPYDVTVCCQP